MKTRLLYVYGILLVLTAFSLLMIVGEKTFNLRLTCLIFSVISIALARYFEKKSEWPSFLVSLVPLTAFIIFAYRSAINLLALIGIVQHELNHYDAYNKCINLIFLIFLASGSLTTSLIIIAGNNKKAES